MYCPKMNSRADWFLGYHERLAQVYRFWAPPGQRILEIGCGLGHLLSTLSPAYSVGVDFSQEMILRASQAHPELEFLQIDVHDLKQLQNPFDVIILSDLVNEILLTAFDWSIRCNNRPCVFLTFLETNSFHSPSPGFRGNPLKIRFAEQRFYGKKIMN